MIDILRLVAAILLAICAWPVLLVIAVLKWTQLIFDAATEKDPRKILDSILDIARMED